MDESVKKICEACVRGSHEHCSGQISAANAPCDCKFCWGEHGNLVAMGIKPRPESK